MKERIIRLILVIGFLFCLYLTNTNVLPVNANEGGLENDSQQPQGQQENELDNPEEDFPDLRGEPENLERERQVPVDLNILQQRYPDVFFLQGDSGQNQVALTFDDGPDPRFTNDVLNVLDQYDVPATFFFLGSRAAAYPEIVTRIQNDGHVIGNHTYFHPNLVDEADIPTLEREVIRTEDELYDIIGYRTHLFRPPYGFLYDELVEQLATMNYAIIGWSVDSLDWQEDPPEVIASNVLNNIHPGAIILMHDGADWDGDRTNTIESLHQIIPTLQEQGYEFVTVPELLHIPFEK